LQLDIEITTITEGKTKILAPKASIENKVPPMDVAFFNPRAKLSRDFSIIAYSAFIKKFQGPKTFLDSMSGVGARGLRVANEIKEIEGVHVNDLNPTALELGRKSAELNNLQNYHASEEETCRFLSSFSRKGMRAAIVDIDPFGSPTRHLDCGIRATVHGGILSVTATDLQVLHGLFNDACRKKYYGTPIKTHYADEIAIRLILGCIHMVAARLDVEATPVFVENNMHYYRVYVRILNKSDTRDIMGFVSHCKSCGNREIGKEKKEICDICKEKMIAAGPLWIGSLFEKEFLKDMLDDIPNHIVDKKCEKTIQRCILESDMPGCYYTLDELAEMRKKSPASLENSIAVLQKNGYRSSPTSFNPTGFRTDCKINKILELFSS
jgi:tRNA (guanine26-N2/guanine27-N2)-dimethyltransferase